MMTFDLAQIQDFVADLDARMGHDRNGARESQAALNMALVGHAELCQEFVEKVNEWRQAVFSGRIEFDSEVEAVVLAEGMRLLAWAEELWSRGATPKAAELDLTTPFAPRPPIEWMNHPLKDWFPPKLAVGPGPRHWKYATEEMSEEMSRRVAALPPLAAGWRPDDPEQRERFQNLRKS